MIWIQFEITRPVAAIKSLRFALFSPCAYINFQTMCHPALVFRPAHNEFYDNVPPYTCGCPTTCIWQFRVYIWSLICVCGLNLFNIQETYAIFSFFFCFRAVDVSLGQAQRTELYLNFTIVLLIIFIPLSTDPRLTASMKVLLGSYSQSNERFSDLSRGRQCVPCCLIFLICLSKSNHAGWEWEELNNIIDNGDNLYTIVSALNKRTSDFLMPIELPSTICLHDQFYSIKFLNNPFGIISSTESGGIGSPLKIGLMDAFGQSKICILILNEYAIAVAKVAANKFVLFDAHSRNKNGLPDSEGTSILMEFSSIDTLHKHIMKLSHALNVLDQQYEVIPITVCVINKMSALKVKSHVAFIDSPAMSQVPVVQADHSDMSGLSSVTDSLSVTNLDCHSVFNCLMLMVKMHIMKNMTAAWNKNCLNEILMSGAKLHSEMSTSEGGVKPADLPTPIFCDGKYFHINSLPSVHGFLTRNMYGDDGFLGHALTNALLVSKKLLSGDGISLSSSS